MIRKLLHDVSLALVISIAITLLVFCTTWIVIAWHYFGWRGGLLCGVLLFFFCEGPQLLFDILERLERKARDEPLDDPIDDLVRLAMEMRDDPLDEQETDPFRKDRLDDPP